MAKMSELDRCIRELRTAAESLNAVADSLMEFYSGNPKQPAESGTPPPTLNEPQTAPIPIETIVELAKEKAVTHGKKAIKALLDKFESPSVSGLPQEKRAAFKAELEALE